MPIIYPLQFPSAPKPIRLRWRMDVAVGSTRSQFTYNKAVSLYQGEEWQVDITLPTLSRAQAGVFRAFMAAMRGMSGQCLFGDPTDVFQGSGVSDGVSVPLVHGNSQTGITLATRGWKANSSGVVKAGDLICVNGENYPHLHVVLGNVASDGSGNASLDLFPRIREAADGNTITLAAPQGAFHLAHNQPEWDVDSALHHTTQISLVEWF